MAKLVSIESLQARVESLELVQAKLLTLLVQLQWQPQYKPFDRKERFVECLWCHGCLDVESARSDVAALLTGGDLKSLLPIQVIGDLKLGHSSTCELVAALRAVARNGAFPWRPIA